MKMYPALVMQQCKTNREDFAKSSRARLTDISINFSLICNHPRCNNAETSIHHRDSATREMQRRAMKAMRY